MSGVREFTSIVAILVVAILAIVRGATRWNWYGTGLDNTLGNCLERKEAIMYDCEGQVVCIEVLLEGQIPSDGGRLSTIDIIADWALRGRSIRSHRQRNASSLLLLRIGILQ